MAATAREIIAGITEQFGVEKVYRSHDAGAAVIEGPSSWSCQKRNTVTWVKSASCIRLDQSYSAAMLIGPGDLDFDGDRLLARMSDFARSVVLVDEPRRVMAYVIRTFFGDLIREPALQISPLATIHPSAVIGAEGQGFYTTPVHALERFPQIAGVRIDEGVEVGPCSTIMRGCLDDTVIMRGSKIGNGVNIGHGAWIDRDTLVCAHASIGGSAIIGRDVRIWMGALIASGVHVGDGAEVGMGAVVLADVPARTRVVGSPARVVRRFKDGAGI